MSKPQYSGRTISFNSMALRRHYRQLREELAKLPPPPGLEEMNHPFSAAVTLASPNPSSAISTSSSQMSQMNDMDFVVSNATATSSSSPTKEDETALSAACTAASILLNDLSKHALFNKTATNTGTSTTMNSMDDDGSNESNVGASHMNHISSGDGGVEGGSSSSSDTSTSGKEQQKQIASAMTALEKEIKNELDNIFSLEDGDSSE